MDLKPGAEVVIDGQRLRYVGDGKFEAVGEEQILAKRFDTSDERPLGGPVCD